MQSTVHEMAMSLTLLLPQGGERRRLGAATSGDGHRLARGKGGSGRKRRENGLYETLLPVRVCYIAVHRLPALGLAPQRQSSAGWCVSGSMRSTGRPEVLWAPLG